MPKMKFRYSVMNSGKTLQLLAVAHNYEELGHDIKILTPSIDTRSDIDEVASRVGLSHKATPVYPQDDIKDIVTDRKYACILVDECEFLQPKQVKELSEYVDEYDVPVIAYGLKNDFQNNLFPASEAFLIYADEVEEIVTICSFCSKKAIMNARVVDGKRITTGDQVVIGGNESYIPVCRKCYNSMPVYDNEKS